LASINSSTAGVTASYDSVNDRFVLTNNSTGDTGIGANEVSGGLLDAMGLTAGSTLQRGLDAKFTLNGGATITSKSNTLTAAEHGITGLSIKVDSATTQTVTVASDTEKTKSTLQAFITAFNTVESYIDDQTKVTVGADGKVSTATLGDNREVEAWGSKLRSLASSTISGLSSSVTRLEDLGIGFSSISAQLSIKDSAKLDAALANSSDDISGFFSNTVTGFTQQFATYLTALNDSSQGALSTQTSGLIKQNTDIDAQIVTLNRRIEDQRTLLTSAFLAMQDAQSAATSQQKTIENMFPTKSSSSG
jgi:flagellar hook-associated protein 2